MLHYRPRESQRDLGGAFYSPRRDLAHIGVDLMRASVFAHEEQFQEAWYKAFLEQHGLTKESIEEGLKLLAGMAKRIVDDTNPAVAAEATGFSELPPAVQLAVYGKLGQVFLAAVWKGVKDVKMANSGTPLEVFDLVRAVEDFIAGGAVARPDAIPPT
jgi:hypothetical protein